MTDNLQQMLDDCWNELLDIENKISNLDDKFDNSVGYFTNYALIKASGTLEYVFRAIIVDFFSGISDPRVSAYLDKMILQGSLSVKYENMQSLLNKFDSNWKKNFKNAVESRANSQELIQSSNSLVANRHSFAHGRTITASFLDIKKYYLDIVELIKVFDSVVL